MTHFDPVEANQVFASEGWTKSFRSQPNSNACVQWNFAGAQVGVRDSKQSEGPVLGLDATQWAAFQDAVAGRTMHG